MIPVSACVLNFNLFFVLCILGSEDQSAHEDSEEMETTTVETEIAEEERASDGDCRDKSRVSKDEKKGGGPETLEDAASGPGDDQTKDGNEEMATGHNTEPSTSPVPRVRPNPMYCFLLGYGRVGHILIMESILVIEWIKTYFPMLASLLDSVSAKIFPRNGGAIDGSDDFGLSQTTGFVSTDGSVVRGGKKRRAQTKKEDEKALSQLKQIGDIRQAKYRFLSESFMERHGLGLYASEWAEETVEVTDGLLSRGSRKKKGLEQEAEESDAEWIVEALTQESPSIQSKSAVEPNIDMSLGNSGASVRVGVEVSLGKSTKKRRRSSISDVARQTLVVKTKKPSGPRVSDRESGVMGRIRAAGANSLMGRSIMGAYPGDAPSPSEAADARGLIDLARKYGYGDWSDDEEEDDNEKPRKERRKKKERSLVGSQKGKGRKSRSSSLGLEFDFRSSDSVPRATARSALRHKNSVLGAAMDTLGEHRLGNDHRRKKRKSKFAEPAMENLREEDKSTKTRRVKKKVVRPAMELLKEVESKGGEESN